MKKNIFYGIMMVAAGVLSATSCTDFSDYNDVKQDATPSANQTLWENISSDSELTHFASLVKKAGYDKILNSANSYTVWAPVDSKLDLSQYENLDSAQLVQQLIKNHVANYSYVVSGAWDEPKRVNMQNNKSYNFINNGICSFDNINVLATNVASSNGVMHKIDGVAKYYPNITTFLNDTAKAKALGLDSLSAHYRKYNVSYLDTKSSVIGPIVDGKQTYIDSVMVNYNLLNDWFGAKLDNEDSTYTVVLPTNEAWKDQLTKGKAYYNFNAKIPYRTLDNSNNVSDQQYTVTDMEFLKDSLVKQDIFRSLLFNNNDMYNKWLIGDQTVSNDTLRSVTKSYKFSNPQEMLSSLSYEEEMSNGQIKVVNDFAAHPWEVYSKKLTIDALSNVIKVKNGSASRTPYIWSTKNDSRTYRYLYVEPATQSSSPEVEIMLPNVKSDTYNVYAVFLPSYSHAADSLDQRPNKYKISIYYAKNNATSTSQWRFSSDGVENPTSDSKQADYLIDNTTRNFIDAAGMLLADTVFVGKMTFPVSYAKTNIGPSINIKIPFIKAAERNDYNREIRLISIVLCPVAQDEYEATKED